ncbi:hypothetical protein A2W14_03990 [Candidatus Gottesmanbacteria bacterium RBG_16_37_8]|uniref:Metallo-beta-lactamase domain-containing protein n=1 Tax=Candidatus Gottesmanbacteria bacterium RBG_16_37_8 TaxID=1798371 RepID=A0A1F5YUS0_9BACT|nr:MAG: hypothetical protein A2W14_03990 [Candidatus Gottesmanbacteria bacterium RBG_16_37_8]
MEIITLTVGRMQENCYLVFDNKTKKGIVIDPGDDADYIERIIADHTMIPQAIIATHGHFDHLMAAIELVLAYKIPFIINCLDKFLVNNLSQSAKHFLGIEAGPPPPVAACLKDKEKIMIGKYTLTVIYTPGHTPGSICLYDKSNNILFTGDTLFADGGIGRTDFSYSDQHKLTASLKKIFRLPGQTCIFPGHGRVSTLEEEKIYHHL